jgi:hypothetical protein
MRRPGNVAPNNVSSAKIAAKYFARLICGGVVMDAAVAAARFTRTESRSRNERPL